MVHGACRCAGVVLVQCDGRHDDDAGGQYLLTSQLKVQVWSPACLSLGSDGGVMITKWLVPDTLTVAL